MFAGDLGTVRERGYGSGFGAAAIAVVVTVEAS